MSMRLTPAPKVAVVTDDDRLAVVTNHRHTKNITSDPVEVLLGRRNRNCNFANKTLIGF